MQQTKYHRILVKLSGEQLSGQQGAGIDPQEVQWIAGEIKKALETGAQIAIMIGGGNYVRGAQLAGNGIERVTADSMGMLATMINGLALADMFNTAGVPARVLSSVKADQIVDQFTHRRAINHLQKNRVVIVAGGIGRPYLTTDTGAVSLALELNCDVVCKLTKVDGVYDKDPFTNSDATKFETLSFQEAVEKTAIKVMDKAALGLAMEQHKPIIVLALKVEDNLRRAVLGEPVGTTIS